MWAEEATGKVDKRSNMEVEGNGKRSDIKIVEWTDKNSNKLWHCLYVLRPCSAEQHSHVSLFFLLVLRNAFWMLQLSQKKRAGLDKHPSSCASTFFHQLALQRLQHSFIWKSLANVSLFLYLLLYISLFFCYLSNAAVWLLLLSFFECWRTFWKHKITVITLPIAFTHNTSFFVYWKLFAFEFRLIVNVCYLSRPPTRKNSSPISCNHCATSLTPGAAIYTTMSPN